MKIILFCLLLISNISWGGEVLNLEIVTKKIKEQNLTVLQNAEKVYQAKTSIDEARLNLLPRLNLWNLGKIVIDPSALLDVAQDFAPFLVPANWFRMRETEILYNAEKEGYLALRANEVFAARSLYMQVLMDQSLYDSLVRFEAEYAVVKNIVEDRFDLGLESAEIVRDIQVQHLNILEDLSQLRLLVNFEKTHLAQALGMEVSSDLILEPITLNSDEINSPIDPKNWEKIVLEKSPEINQFEYFLKVIPLLKKETRFSFLGVPSLSRGTAGGIFDDVPVSQGLGFAKGRQIDIINSKANILQLQKKGIEETLKRQLLNVSNDHNSTLELQSLRETRLGLSELNFKSYVEKLSIGGKLSLPEFSGTILSFLQSQAAFYKSSHNFLINYDRLQRMSFTGAYQSLIEEKAPTVKTAPKKCRKTIFGRTICE